MSAGAVILLGSLPLEITGALHIIFATRNILPAGPFSYLSCMSLCLLLVWGQSFQQGDQGRHLPAVAARLLHHHVQKAGGLWMRYLGKYLLDKYFRVIK